MSSSSKGTVPETSAEKAVSDLASARFRDYQTRWVPRQNALRDTIQRMGKSDSFERESLKSKSAADTSAAFDSAGKQLAVRDANAGINPGSSSSKLRQMGLQTDKAASIGIGSTVADQMIDDAYTSGLSQLMSMGRGQEGTAARGMGQAAQISGGIAQNDAEISAQQRAGNYDAAGTFAGIGAASAMRRRPSTGGGGTNLFANDQPGQYSNVGGGGFAGVPSN